MKKLWQSFSSQFCGIPRTVVEDFVRKCPNCNVNNPLKEHDIVRNITASQNWERIQIDLVDLRHYVQSNDGLSWILHIIDVYSRFSFAFALKNKSAVEVILFRGNF